MSWGKGDLVNFSIFPVALVAALVGDMIGRYISIHPSLHDVICNCQGKQALCSIEGEYYEGNQ